MAGKTPLTFEDFKLAGQNDDSFDIMHPDGSTFQVAKKALDEPTLASIASMAPAAPPPAPATPNNTSLDAVNAEIMAGQKANAGPSLADIGKFLTQPIGGGLPQSVIDNPSLAPGLAPFIAQARQKQKLLADNEGGMLPPGDHSAGPLAPGQTVSEGDIGIAAPQAGKAQAATAAPGSVDATQNSAFALQRQGILGAAKAQQDAAAAQAEAFKAQEARLKEAADTYKANRDKLDAENAQLFQSVMDDKIEPGRFMANLSTGNKILAGISLVLGGAGGGLNGSGRNAAMEVLQKTIDADIDAQKTNLGKKQSLLTQNLQKTRDLQEAEAMTRSQILAMTSAQVERAKASAQGPLAKAQADQLLGVLKLDQAKANEAAAQRATLRALGKGQLNNVNPEELRQTGNPMLTDAADRIIKLPDGKQALVQNKEDVKELRDKVSTVTPIFGLLDKLEKIGSKAIVSPQANELAQAIRGQISILLKKNTELQKMFSQAPGKEGEKFSLMDMIENPKEFKNLLGDSGKTAQLKSFIMDTLGAELDAKLSGGYKRFTPKTEQKFVANTPREKR